MRFIFMIFVVSIFFVVGCDGVSSPNGGGGYEFTDQNLQGTVNSAAWTFVSGTAEETMGDSTSMTIMLYGVAATGGDPCESDAYGFSTPFVSSVMTKQTGIYELGMSQVVNIYDGSINNLVYLSGAIEISSIDTDTSLEVTGKVDAAYNSSNDVNGNFTVTWCPSSD